MKIYALQTGIVHVKSDFVRGSVALGGTLPFLYHLFTDKQTLDLPVYAWVIEHEEGVIVVDTGELAQTKLSFITQSTFTIASTEQIGAQLKQMGIGPRDVKKVIITHLHGDHIDGVADFEGIDCYLSPDELAYYRSSFGGAFTRRTAAIPRWFTPHALPTEDRSYGPFDHIFPITRAGDVFGVPTPGHTIGHMSVVAVDEDVHVFMAGDVTYNQAALLTQTLQGPSIVSQAHVQTLRRVLNFARSRPTIYLPAHDIESGQRLRSRQIA